MAMLRVESYEDLTQACAQSKSEYQILCVFMQIDSLLTEPGHNDVATAYLHVLHNTNMPVRRSMTFSAVRNCADAEAPNWNLVVVGLVSNADQTLPNDQQIQSFLSDMKMRILNGFIDGFIVFDRNGDVVDVQAMVEASYDPSALN
ncbi:MAG: hypothetical protein OQK24_06760 [Magnetovibrio sp.]|nr:hypothetical protein [Magnetovibrio sp.]